MSKNPGCYKDIEGKEPCSIGESVALYVQHDGAELIQPKVSNRPTASKSDLVPWLIPSFSAPDDDISGKWRD